MFELERTPSGLAEPDNAQLLTGILRGTERESLRTTDLGEIALTPHPKSLGSALTHPQITTDFSEALLEFITPPTHSVDGLLASLSTIQRYTQDHLGEELLWTSSMPCKLGKDENIPVARYGTSNNGQMKTIYRIGLGHRYGRAMQTVSGIHYNFSLPDAFWAYLRQEANCLDDLQSFKDKHYFNLIRNFRRHYWLLIYLFGASPAVCSTYVANRTHNLSMLADGHTLYRPFATSLRMGDLGYQSSAQESLYVCYDKKQSYINSLCNAITRPHPHYENIGLKDTQGNYLQLNTSLLQIENEFYSAIRPKRTAKAGETAIAALTNRGVEYVEVRCLDVNPFDPLGITKEQIHFLDAFLLYCVLAPSPETSREESTLILNNQKLVVNNGREPGVTLQHLNYGPLTVTDWGEDLLKALMPIAELLDNANQSTDHQASIEIQMSKIKEPKRTLSAQLLKTLTDENLNYQTFSLRQSLSHREQLREIPVDDLDRKRFKDLAHESLLEQLALEKAQSINFDDYLSNYYSQYTCCDST